MEFIKQHSKAIIICAIVLVLIIVLLCVKVAPIDFNELYSDLDEEEYWCSISEDGTWMKISLFDYSSILDQIEVELINEDLGFSSAVYEQMMDTRAIDGRQTAYGKNVKVSWSYGDSELSILYEADGNARSLFGDYAPLVVVIVVMIACIAGGFILLSLVPDDDAPLIKTSIRNDSENGAGQQTNTIDGDTSCSEAITPESVEPPSRSDETEQQFSAADEILKFKKLLDMGVITQEEFEAKKKELLGL